MVERESEWRVVNRRGRGVGYQVSERPPVRHQNFPSPRFTQPFWRDGRRRTDRQNPDRPKIQSGRDRNKIEVEEKANVVTFFFNNFPENCHPKVLWKVFEKIGVVRDVFCPKKIDKKGKAFGFVRFEGLNEEETLLEKLNGIWIGSFKIRAFVPRFKRERGQKIVTEEKAQEYRQVITQKSLRKADISFVDVVEGNLENRGKDSSQNQEDGWRNVKVEFNTETGEREWLENCFTGHLKSGFSWKEHGEEIQGECGNRLTITPLGGKLLLIRTNSEEPIKKVIGRFDEWSGFWFDWCREWKHIDVNQNRIIWTRWTGVPLHAWNFRFFSLVSSKIGRFVEMDENTRSRKRLDAARIKISTSLRPIEGCIECVIDGASFHIYIGEDRSQTHTNEDDAWESSESGSDEQVISEDEFSDDSNLANYHFAEEGITGEEETVQGRRDLLDSVQISNEVQVTRRMSRNSDISGPNKIQSNGLADESREERPNQADFGNSPSGLKVQSKEDRPNSSENRNRETESLKAQDETTYEYSLSRRAQETQEGSLRRELSTDRERRAEGSDFIDEGDSRSCYDKQMEKRAGLYEDQIVQVSEDGSKDKPKKFTQEESNCSRTSGTGSDGKGEGCIKLGKYKEKEVGKSEDGRKKKGKRGEQSQSGWAEFIKDMRSEEDTRQEEGRTGKIQKTKEADDNRIRGLEEAGKTWEFGKKLGLNGGSKEEEIIEEFRRGNINLGVVNQGDS